MKGIKLDDFVFESYDKTELNNKFDTINEKLKDMPSLTKENSFEGTQNFNNDVTFSARPRVKENGEEHEVLLRTDAEDFVSADSQNVTENEDDEKYHLSLTNEGATLNAIVYRQSDNRELHSILMDKDKLQINNIDMPSLRHFANMPISSVFTTLTPANIRKISLKFRNDTNLKGCSYDVKTSSTGQVVSNYLESESAMIVVANEEMVFRKSFSYESTYEFACGNYKLAWSGGSAPKLSYYGIQYTTESAGAHWIEAMTSTDFSIDADVEIIQ